MPDSGRTDAKLQRQNAAILEEETARKAAKSKAQPGIHPTDSQETKIMGEVTPVSAVENEACPFEVQLEEILREVTPASEAENEAKPQEPEVPKINMEISAKAEEPKVPGITHEINEASEETGTLGIKEPEI